MGICMLERRIQILFPLLKLRRGMEITDDGSGFDPTKAFPCWEK